MAWRCVICGYVHEGPEPPDECPLCGAPRDDFEPVEEAPSSVTPLPTAQAPDRIVIVGAGIAGLSAAEAARSAAPHSSITLISAENEWPYSRLNLTRLLAGEISEDQLPIHPTGWYEEQRIDFLRGNRVMELRPGDRKLKLNGGKTVDFDKLVLATGATAYRPPVSGTEFSGTGVLRSLDDARRLIAVARKGARIIVIGGGLLGLEAAAGLASRGAEVTVLESMEWLLPRQLNRRAGERLAQTAEAAGFRVRTGVKVERLEDGLGGPSVRLADGTVLPSDYVLFSAGIRSDLTLAREAKLAVNRGVVTDDRLATSNPDIFAAGDVAEHRGIVYGLWEPAHYQGRIAGGNVAGNNTMFGGIPLASTLKVLQIKVFSIGTIDPKGNNTRPLEAENESAYSLFILEHNRLVGAILMGNTHLATAARRAVEKQLVLSSTADSAASIAEWLKSI